MEDFGYFMNNSFVSVHCMMNGKMEVGGISKDEDPERFQLVKDYIEHGNFEAVKQLIFNKDLEEFVEAVCKVGKNEVKGRLARVILDHYNQGLNAKPLENFVARLYKNPSYRVVNQLFDFIEASRKNAGGFTITEDGYIIGYKKIRSDFTDCHTGTFDNHPGKIVEIPRNEVDEDPNKTCSKGLHFCAFNYLAHFGSCSCDKIVIVKVDPSDVVAIPVDYNNSKARCCKYEVIDEYTGADKEKENAMKAALVYEDVKKLRKQVTEPKNIKKGNGKTFADMVKEQLNIKDDKIKAETGCDIRLLSFEVGNTNTTLPDFTNLSIYKLTTLHEFYKNLTERYKADLYEYFGRYIVPPAKFGDKARAIHGITKLVCALNSYYQKNGKRRKIFMN